MHADDGTAEICCQVCLAGVPIGHCFPELWLPWGGEDNGEAPEDLHTAATNYLASWQGYPSHLPCPLSPGPMEFGDLFFWPPLAMP